MTCKTSPLRSSLDLPWLAHIQTKLGERRRPVTGLRAPGPGSRHHLLMGGLTVDLLMPYLLPLGLHSFLPPHSLQLPA